MRPRIDPMGQRELALALRYHIDLAIQRGDQHRDIVARLVRTNPTSVRSRHVAHNLGVARLAWLEDQGLLHAREPVEDHVP